MVDCSGSVGPVNFKRQQDFITDMIRPLHIGRNLFLGKIQMDIIVLALLNV